MKENNNKYMLTFEKYTKIYEMNFFKKLFGVGATSNNKETFMKNLEMIENMVNENPDKYVFDKEQILKKAKENNYRGSLRVQRGGRDYKRFYVVYDKGYNTLQKLGMSTRIH